MSDYQYFMLHLADGTQVEVEQLPDFDSAEPVQGDPPDQGEAGSVWFIPRQVVFYEVK